ncbi:MAG: putative Zn finger-like uncharacterized protein [Halioglobus sp.]|jgi:predicted Zn finger-like uncharacterized protein
MKCRCPKCKTKMEIKNDGLRRLKHKVFKCPKCNHLLKIKPSEAKCFHCNETMFYYKFDFIAANRVAQCYACKEFNKMPYVID